MKVSIEVDIDNLGGERVADILLGVTVDLESHSLNRTWVALYELLDVSSHTSQSLWSRVLSSFQSH